jgi:hypothetical protein
MLADDEVVQKARGLPLRQQVPGQHQRQGPLGQQPDGQLGNAQPAERQRLGPERQSSMLYTLDITVPYQ